MMESGAAIVDCRDVKRSGSAWTEYGGRSGGVKESSGVRCVQPRTIHLCQCCSEEKVAKGKLGRHLSHARTRQSSQ